MDRKLEWKIVKFIPDPGSHVVIFRKHFKMIFMNPPVVQWL